MPTCTPMCLDDTTWWHGSAFWCVCHVLTLPHGSAGPRIHIPECAHRGGDTPVCMPAMSQCHHKVAQARLFALLSCPVSPCSIVDTHICIPAVLVSPYDGVVTSVCNHAVSQPCHVKPGHACLYPCRIPARLRAAWIHLFTHLLCSSATTRQPVLHPSATTRQWAPTYSHACNVPEHRHTCLHVCRV